MTLPEVEQLLSRALVGPLPGLPAQLAMAPRPPAPWPEGGPARPAAALLLLLPHDAAVHLVLTVRSDALLHHGGQVSLPGGTVESGESIERAALREAAEEIGIEPACVRLLGPLTPLDIAVSGFRLHPVVGTTAARPRLSAATGEVAQIVEVPLRELMQPAALGRQTRQRGDRRFEAPYFFVSGLEVWGATAMILAELLALLGYTPDPWTD